MGGLMSTGSKVPGGSTVTQPASAVTQPASTVTQPASAVTQPASAVTQPAPTVTQPALRVHHASGSSAVNEIMDSKEDAKPPYGDSSQSSTTEMSAHNTPAGVLQASPAVSKESSAASTPKCKPRKSSAHQLLVDFVGMKISPRSSPTPSEEGRRTPSPRPKKSRENPLFGEAEGRRMSEDEAMKANVLVKTGDQEKAGTNANVYVYFEDENGLKTPKIKLDLPFYNDLERGVLDTYSLRLPEGFERVTKLYMFRDRKGHYDDWFCDYVILQDPRLHRNKKFRKITNPRCPGIVTTAGDDVGLKAEYYFPIHRWVNHSHEYVFLDNGSCLPQFDPCSAAREEDLKLKRNVFQYKTYIPDGPLQIKELPSDEKFSDSYFWTFASEKALLLAETKFIECQTFKWSSFDNYKKVFKTFKNHLWEPACTKFWKEDDWFALQRVMGTDCLVISLCTAIPAKLAVSNETVVALLEGFTLDEALQRNKIFLCDLHVLQSLTCPDNQVLAAPFALFYLNKANDLKPIAIQLMQDPGPNNPVFTPQDSESTWLVAKMYYNNAEAQHHQGSTHLGRTHIVMEGVVVCTHRNLSPSHPLFKLLAPHFLFLLAINSRGLQKLVSPGGWVDNCMTQGVSGIYELISKSVRTWRADIHGVPEEEMRKRGVLDPEVLPYYPYRDDAIPVYAAIRTYVTTILNHHYDCPEKIKEDGELRLWRAEIIASNKEGGLGIAGVGGGDDGFTSVSELIDLTTAIIATCSMGHAASNFTQYEQYAFVPNYPGKLMKPPPTDKREYTEEDIMNLLPIKRMTLDIMVITKLLSKRGTKKLGDFEMQYLFDPVSVKAAQNLQKELEKLSLTVRHRNVDRPYKYDCLDPAFVPNSISV